MLEISPTVATTGLLPSACRASNSFPSVAIVPNRVTEKHTEFYFVHFDKNEKL